MLSEIIDPEPRRRARFIKERSETMVNELRNYFDDNARRLDAKELALAEQKKERAEQGVPEEEHEITADEELIYLRKNSSLFNNELAQKFISPDNLLRRGIYAPDFRLQYRELTTTLAEHEFDTKTTIPPDQLYSEITRIFDEKSKGRGGR